jgi:ubiquinone/menaquinone biosynthesis C-methylase UbiE
MQPGMTVAEIGAGRGRMAVLLARRLGPSSRIYATEIEPEKQNAIRSAAAGLASFSVLPAAESSVNLPEACCDAIYLRRVYHHLSDSAAINRSLYLSLRAGGRLAIIDMLTPRWIFWTRHGIPAETVVAQVTAAGFRLERRVDRWSPIDYCLVFQKVPRGP